MSATGCKKNLADLENVDTAKTKGRLFLGLFVASGSGALLRSSPSHMTGVVSASVPGRSTTNAVDGETFIQSFPIMHF